MPWCHTPLSTPPSPLTTRPHWTAVTDRQRGSRRQPWTVHWTIRTACSNYCHQLMVGASVAFVFGFSSQVQSLIPVVEDEEGCGLEVEGYHGACLTGPALWATQAGALLVKRAIYTYRRLLSYTVQTVLPLSLIILGLGIAKQLQVNVTVCHLTYMWVEFPLSSVDN